MRIKHWLHFLLVPLPSFVKVPLYRLLFGYRIDKGVRIGLSLVRADKCSIGRNARIGHFNFISHMRELRLGEDSIIGTANVILGGVLVEVGDRALIGRFNEINSIIDPIATGTADPCLVVGRAAVITAWHKIDYTDRVDIGESTIIAGRHSCLWTHNRQQVGPVAIGRNCYVGSGVQFVPRSGIGDYCVVGLGSVITKPIVADWSLVAGVPAKLVKPLDEAGRALVEFPTRPDLEPAAAREHA